MHDSKFSFPTYLIPVLNAITIEQHVLWKKRQDGDFAQEELVFLSTLARTSDTHRTPMLSALSLPARCCKLATIPQHLRRIPAIKRSFIYKQKEVAHPTEQRCGRQRRQNCYYYKLFFIIHFPYYKLEILYYSMRNATAICRNRHIR